MTRYIAILALALCVFAIPATAQTDAGCMRCNLPYRLSDDGAGFARDHKGLCPTCEKIVEDFRNQDSIGWFEINENKYLTFADGTVIDLKHFRGSALLSRYLPSVVDTFLPEFIEGILIANAIGFAIELNQQHNGHPSGHPYGTNEDMYSNFMGSTFGQFGYSPMSEWSWTSNAISYLEAFHGSLASVTDKDPNKK